MLFAVGWPSLQEANMLERVFEDHPYLPAALATALVAIGFVIAYW